MKPNPWIFPALALFVVVGWIGVQKKTAASLEREISLVTERIAQVRTGMDAGGKTREAEDKARKEKDRKIDWKDLAGKIGQMRNGTMPDMRAMMHMQRLLMDLSPQELGAQLDEIAALDLDDAARKQLQGMITGILSEKAPQMVLERFGEDLADDDMGRSWQLGMALGRWADKDPAAASAWLDKQIAAGKFESKSLDGKNESLVRFESSLVGALLKTDPAAAAARVASLPEEQRVELFQQGFSFQLEAKNEAAYANLVRGSVAADKVGGILADTAGNLAVRGDYERVDGFIAASQAGDEEKKSIVEQVMKSKLSSGGGSEIKTEDLDKARAWAATQSPGAVDKATGEVLASTMWRGGDFNKASALVLQYNEGSGNDEVLTAFLRSNSMRNNAKDQVEALIDKIKDPAVREEIRNLPQFKK